VDGLPELGLYPTTSKTTLLPQQPILMPSLLSTSRALMMKVRLSTLSRRRRSRMVLPYLLVQGNEAARGNLSQTPDQSHSPEC
jgi:hypothetical protein